MKLIKPADSSISRFFVVKKEKKRPSKTNVFDAKTGESVHFYHKNPIIAYKIGENENSFVKLTKIGIEIYDPFVYNVFIAAPKTKAA